MNREPSRTKNKYSIKTKGCGIVMERNCNAPFHSRFQDGARFWWSWCTLRWFPRWIGWHQTSIGQNIFQETPPRPKETVVCRWSLPKCCPGMEIRSCDMIDSYTATLLWRFRPLYLLGQMFIKDIQTEFAVAGRAAATIETPESIKHRWNILSPTIWVPQREGKGVVLLRCALWHWFWKFGETGLIDLF